ncbi:MAG: hypothetical protein WCQ77_05410 [Planctomycetota bacterium]
MRTTRGGTADCCATAQDPPDCREASRLSPRAQTFPESGRMTELRRFYPQAQPADL